LNGPGLHRTHQDERSLKARHLCGGQTGDKIGSTKEIKKGGYHATLNINGAPGVTRTRGTRIRNHPFNFRGHPKDSNKINALNIIIILSLLSRILENVNIF